MLNNQRGEPGASKSFKGASSISEEGIMEEFYNLDKTCKTLKTVWFLQPMTKQHISEDLPAFSNMVVFQFTTWLRDK